MQVFRKETYDLITLLPLFDMVYRWINSVADSELVTYIFSNIHRSKSQLQHDLFALYVSYVNPTRSEVSEEFGTSTLGHYFAEFGAANGAKHSNT